MTDQSSEKPYISVSRMESYSRCPEAFRRRYIEVEKIPPAIAMAKGSAVHRGAEVNFRQKIETHTDLATGDIIDAAAADFDKRSADLSLSADEQSRGKGVVIGEALDSVVSMAEVHAREQAPDYQPVLVEERIEVELPGSPVNLLGVIDLADDRRRVVDLKTANRKKPESDAHESVQLTAYAAAYHAITGEESAEQRLDCIVETKTKTSRQVITTHRSVGDYVALAARINAIQAAIDAGSFPPTSPMNWVCSDRFCGYHSTCVFVNGSRRQND